MIAGSDSMVAVTGITARPMATSLRTSSGSTASAGGAEGHLLGDDAALA